MNKQEIMKMTFICPGLIERELTLHADGVEIPLKFTGGSMGYNGVIPGRYVTDNAAIQHIIMHSKQYKDKRIVLLESKERKG